MLERFHVADNFQILLMDSCADPCHVRANVLLLTPNPFLFMKQVLHGTRGLIKRVEVPDEKLTSRNLFRQILLESIVLLES